MLKALLTAVLVVICLSQKDIDNAVCKALCQQDEYDGGYSDGQKGCYCMNRRKFEKKLTIRPAPIEPPSTYFRTRDD